MTLSNETMEMQDEKLRGIFKIVVVFAMIAFSVFANSLYAQTFAKTPDGKGTPKYVFLFIGDGMSYPQIQAATYFSGKDAGGIVDNVKKSVNPSDAPKPG